MPYYDFANQTRSKPKKYRHFLLIFLSSVALGFIIWHLSHEKVAKTPFLKKKTVTRSIEPSVRLALPANRVFAQQKAKPVTQNNQPEAPKLEFYEILKAPAKSAALAGGSGSYSLQIAALPSAAAAREVIDLLKQHAFSAHIVRNSNGGATRWNRVILGPYNTEADALSNQKKLESLGHRGVLLISSKGDVLTR